MDKIQLIQNSVRCFWCGLAGCIPLLGLPFAVNALWKFLAVRKAASPEWNPARAYLLWGLTLGIIGLLFTVVVVLAVGLVLILRISEGRDL